MELEIEVKSNASIATNVVEVSQHYLAELDKFKGLVATDATLKDDKKKCADINKLKKFVSELRIAFDRAVENQPDVKAVHDALKAIEDKCDEVHDSYWESCKAIEDVDKPAEETFLVSVNFTGITMKQLESMKKKWAKCGIEFEVLGIVK